MRRKGHAAAMPEQAPQAGAALTALLRRAPDSNAPIAQECFKLLGTLMRSCASYQVRAASVSSKSLQELARCAVLSGCWWCSRVSATLSCLWFACFAADCSTERLWCIWHTHEGAGANTGQG